MHHGRGRLAPVDRLQATIRVAPRPRGRLQPHDQPLGLGGRVEQARVEPVAARHSAGAGSSGRFSAPTTTTILRLLLQRRGELDHADTPASGYSRIGSTKIMNRVRRSRTWSRTSRRKITKTFDQRIGVFGSRQGTGVGSSRGERFPVEFVGSHGTRAGVLGDPDSARSTR